MGFIFGPIFGPKSEARIARSVGNLYKQEDHCWGPKWSHIWDQKWPSWVASNLCAGILSFWPVRVALKPVCVDCSFLVLPGSSLACLAGSGCFGRFCIAANVCRSIVVFVVGPPGLPWGLSTRALVAGLFASPGSCLGVFVFLLVRSARIDSQSVKMNWFSQSAWVAPGFVQTEHEISARPGRLGIGFTESACLCLFGAS